MKQIGQKELLKGMSPSHRKAVELLFDDDDVHHLVILQDEDGERRKLLSVGPTLDYADLTAVQNVEIDGMTVSASVDCRSRESRRGKFFTSKASIRARLKESDLLTAEADGRAMITQNAQLTSEVLRVEDENAALRERLESTMTLMESGEDLKQRIELVDLREAELTRMEEALMTRMDQHMQKGAELEQWEENLFRRERLLSSTAV